MTSLLAQRTSGKDDEESACNEGDVGLIPGLGRSAGEENVYPFQYSCLGNPMYPGVSHVPWWATAHSKQSDMTS